MSSPKRRTSSTRTSTGSSRRSADARTADPDRVGHVARKMIGGDENAARDVGLAIAAADRSPTRQGGPALHPPHRQERGNERGSSASAARRHHGRAREKEPGLRLACEKAKDSEEFDRGSCTLRTRESCLIARGTVIGRPARRHRILEAVPASFGTDGRAPASGKRPTCPNQYVQGAQSLGQRVHGEGQGGPIPGTGSPRTAKQGPSQPVPTIPTKRRPTVPSHPHLLGVGHGTTPRANYLRQPLKNKHGIDRLTAEETS